MSDRIGDARRLASIRNIAFLTTIAAVSIVAMVYWLLGLAWLSKLERFRAKHVSGRDPGMGTGSLENALFELFW
jgi:hypothetical protein